VFLHMLGKAHRYQDVSHPLVVRHVAARHRPMQRPRVLFSQAVDVEDDRPGQLVDIADVVGGVQQHGGDDACDIGSGDR